MSIETPKSFFYEYGLFRNDLTMKIKNKVLKRLFGINYVL